MMSKLLLQVLSGLLAGLFVCLPVARAEGALALRPVGALRVHDESNEPPPALRAQGASRVSSHPTISKEGAGLLIAMVAGLTALSVGTALSDPHSRMRNPVLFGAAAGGVTYVVVGTWSAVHEADTGGPLLAFMSALLVGPLAGALASGVKR